MKALVWISALAGPVLLSSAALAADDVKEVRRTVDLAANGRLEIDTFKGWIDVSTWDRPAAEIVARVEPDGDDRYQAEKVRETEIRIEGSGPAVRVKSDYGRVHGHGFWCFLGDRGTVPFVRYAIRMPRTARLQIRDHKSRSRIAGLAAPLDLKTYKGEVEIREMNGPVRLQTYRGEVRAAYGRYAKSEYETYKGSIELSIPRETAFSLDADLGRRGDLHTDFAMAERSAHWRGSRRIRAAAVNGGGAVLELRTHKGDFRVHAR